MLGKLTSGAGYSFVFGRAYCQSFYRHTMDPHKPWGWSFGNVVGRAQGVQEIIQLMKEVKGEKKH